MRSSANSSVGRSAAFRRSSTISRCSPGQVAAALRATDAAIAALDTPRFAVQVAVAKARVGEAAGIASEIAHQVHGAMGFTHEHQLHHFTRRLLAWRDEYGRENYWQTAHRPADRRRRRRCACGTSSLGMSLLPDATRATPHRCRQRLFDRRGSALRRRPQAFVAVPRATGGSVRVARHLSGSGDRHGRAARADSSGRRRRVAARARREGSDAST